MSRLKTASQSRVMSSTKNKQSRVARRSSSKMAKFFEPTEWYAEQLVEGGDVSEPNELYENS